MADLPASPSRQQISILSLDPLVDAGCNPSRIHCVYGPSKDFGVNGLRLGVLVSQANPDLHVAMEANALLMKISSASVRVRSLPPLADSYN